LPADGKEIAYSDIVKGYEYQAGDYVVLTDKDFERANVRKPRPLIFLSLAMNPASISDFLKNLITWSQTRC
jgi:non-homologous end joining protein Ku